MSIGCRHTHCSCDQCFSCHSRFLRKNDAKTVPQLMEQLRRSYTLYGKPPEVYELKESADIKGWLGLCVESCSNVTSAHQYVIEPKAVDGSINAMIRVKQFARSSDDTWKNAGVILKVRSTLRFVSSDAISNIVFALKQMIVVL